jgi:purine nucleoside permease
LPIVRCYATITFHSFAHRRGSRRATADESIAAHRVVLLRSCSDGERAAADVCAEPKFVRHNHQAVVGIDYVAGGQIAAMLAAAGEGAILAGPG